MEQLRYSLFFGNRRIAIFYSVISFHMYLVKSGIAHTFKNNEVNLLGDNGYWYC